MYRQSLSKKNIPQIWAALTLISLPALLHVSNSVVCENSSEDGIQLSFPRTHVTENNMGVTSIRKGLPINFGG